MINNALQANITFQTFYDQLNPAQKKAVDTIEGPVLVVAGPGTGKTQVLAARIANILRTTDTAPQNILALTFTESAAKNMRDRVVKMIGKAGFYVEITTFHSFCTSIISAYPECFPIERTSQPLTDIERFDLYKSIIKDLPLEALKPLNTPNFYLKDIIRAISDLKRESITEKNFVTLVEESFLEGNEPEKKSELLQFEKKKAKNQELAIIYSTYQERIRAMAKYDFDDMVSLVVQAFRDQETLLQDYQEKFHYFLVDEYQDTNSGQNEVVQLLASFWQEAANVFVVGDPHQSIYRFQGASTENVIGFTQRYPEATVITLELSYRCPQELQDVAHHLIQNNISDMADSELSEQQTSAGKTLRTALTQHLRSQKKRVDAVEIWSAPSQTIEIIQIAEQIQAHIKNDVPAEEIAILYRNNKDVVELVEILEKWGIAYEIDGGSNVFEFEPIRQLLQLLHVVHSFRTQEENEKLFEVFCFDWVKLDTLSVYQLSHLAGVERTTMQELLEAGFDALEEKHPGRVNQEKFESVLKFFHKLKHWAVLDAQMTLPAWFELVIEESGYFNWVKQHANMTEVLLYLNTFFDQVKRFAASRANFKLVDLLEAIETMQTYGIPLIVQDFNITTGAVHLSTVHKAKGREWQYVFVIHCLDGVWGNGRDRNLLPLPDNVLKHSDVSKKERNEDDRRLLYVAITRAKEKTIVSFPETVISNNRVRDVTASMFLHEMQSAPAGLEIKSNQDVIKKQDEYLARLITVRPVVSQDHRTEQFFKHVVSNFKLSVTALNNYLRDPEVFVLQNLLTIPQSKGPYLAFGTAVHAGLEELFKQVMAGDKIDESKVVSRYESVLQREILTPEDLERRLKYGKQVLKKYMETLDTTHILPWQMEKRFGSGFAKTILDDIYLTGRVDRFDWTDASKKFVRMIDYKTGLVKTRNTIEGKTLAAGLSPREEALPESIRGAYKRQLLFYKLLTDLDPTFTPKAVEGIFEFVEPDKKTGKLTTHAFELPDKDVAELKDLIREVMKEIRELKFLELVPSLTSKNQ